MSDPHAVPARGPSRAGPRRKLVIGLVNNMPDAAMQAAEQQFGGLLKAAMSGTEISLRLFSLAGAQRGERARAWMAGRYETADALGEAGLDALIVTGAEPRAPELEAEPYWPALTRVIDWAQMSGLPSLWSCLAAHAVVLHLDGVRRVRLPTKLSGVFQNHRVADDALLAGAPAPLTTPHSRQNGLDEQDLVRSGYQILARSPEAGVDSFVRRGPGGDAALFLQGHPEYAADTLMREYCRDVGRFLRGERPVHPRTPAGYFDAAAEQALAALAERARERPSPELLPLYAAALSPAAPAQTWRASAIQIYRNWLAGLAPPWTGDGAAAVRRRGARRADQPSI